MLIRDGHSQSNTQTSFMRLRECVRPCAHGLLQLQFSFLHRIPLDATRPQTWISDPFGGSDFYWTQNNDVCNRLSRANKQHCSAEHRNRRQSQGMLACCVLNCARTLRLASGWACYAAFSCPTACFAPEVCRTIGQGGEFGGARWQEIPY